MINETHDDLESDTKYLGLDFTYSGTGYNYEEVRLMKANYIYANTHDYFNFNLNFLGYGGTFNVIGLDHDLGISGKKYDGLKSGFGGGIDLKFGVNFKFSKLKIGIGADACGIVEFGNYYRFRTDARPQIDSDEGLVFPTFSLFPFLIYEFSDNLNISTQLNLGMPGFMSPIIAFNNSGNICWISLIPNADSNHQRFAIGVMMEMNQLFNSF